MESKDYLTIDEVLAYLEVSRPTFYRLIKDVKVQTYTKGKRSYWLRTEIENLKKEYETPKPKNLKAA